MSNSSNAAPRKCSSCGKRRVPARRAGGRMSTKCKECFGGQFWSSAYGRWFAEASIRQSPDSMPVNDDDLIGMYYLWQTMKGGKGYKLNNEGKIVHRHDYHISHRDAAKGDGYQGRFTAENLIVATAKANKEAYNKGHIDHGHRVYTNKKSFGSAAKVRQWCGGQYDLNKIVAELGLKKYKAPKKNGSIETEYLPDGIPPRIMLEHQFARFEGGGTSPWRHTIGNPSDQFSTAIIYGIGLGSGKLKEGPEELPEEPDEDF
jgi:hypothetical protein